MLQRHLAVLWSVFIVSVGGELPEAKLETPGIIAYWGYPAEIHTTETSDGYILTLHRVPYGKNDSPPAKPRPVIFLQHGLEGSSSNWVTNLPTQSAAYIFADAGYDVWLGNFRGNKYSRRHAWLPVASKEYWQFSWDEMSSYDLPAMFNYVLNMTTEKSMHYVGHSMGTMTAFALFSHDQSWVARITSMHALGPVATVGHIRGVLKLIAPLTNDISWLMESFGANEFLPGSKIMKWLEVYVCGLMHTGNPLCQDILFLIAGHDSHQMNATRIPIYIAQNPGGTSTMNMQHFGQGVNSKKFNKYDWLTKAANDAHYHQPTPPVYNISQVHVPVHLYWGELDILADPTDVLFIANNLPATTLVANNGYSDFNHLDFIWGERAAAQIYAKVLKAIQS